MKVIRTTKNVTFNLPLCGQMTTIIQGELGGQFFNAECNQMQANILVSYLDENSNKTPIRHGVIVFNEDEINSSFIFNENENAVVNLINFFISSLKNEMFNILTVSNPELLLTDFEIIEI